MCWKGLFNAEELQLYYQITIQARGDIGLAPDEYSGFTMALLRMLAFAPVSASTPAQVRPPTPAAAPSGKRVVPVPERAPRAMTVDPAPAAQPPAAQPPAAQSPAAQPPASAPPADGASWTEIVEGLAVTGMARMLAQHCELVSRDARLIELRLPRAHERLLEKPYQERVKAALQARFGATVHVSITVGESGGNSPVEIAERERQRKEARAISEIEQDPFVRELVEDMDARVNSIKPLQ